MGRGHVIAFAEDPNFRALAHASGLLFINAVVLGPGPQGNRLQVTGTASGAFPKT